MNKDRPIYGRITIDSNRQTLGRAMIGEMLVRAAEVMRHSRLKESSIVAIELSYAALPDMATFDRIEIAEQSMAQLVATDLDEESTFPGITNRRVCEAVGSPEYEAYAKVCDPANREGLDYRLIQDLYNDYHLKFPDCSPHFPKWIDS